MAENRTIRIWANDFIALQTVAAAIKFIPNPNFNGLLGITPTEFGKASVGTIVVFGSPICVFVMEPILFVPNRRVGEKQPDEMAEAK